MTSMDHRGCTAHTKKVYSGPVANDIEDKMCLVVRNPKVTVSEVLQLESGRRSGLLRILAHPRRMPIAILGSMFICPCCVDVKFSHKVCP